MVKNPPANAGDAGDMGSIPGPRRCPGGGNGNPLQYSCLENPMDRGAWQNTACGVAKSQTQLKQLSMHTQPTQEQVLGKKKKEQCLVSTHQLTPIRMATIQKKRNRNNTCWEGCGEIGTHMHCCWERKMGQPLWNTVEQLLKRLKIKRPHVRPSHVGA